LFTARPPIINKVTLQLVPNFNLPKKWTLLQLRLLLLLPHLIPLLHHNLDAKPTKRSGILLYANILMTFAILSFAKSLKKSTSLPAFLDKQLLISVSATSTSFAEYDQNELLNTRFRERRSLKLRQIWKGIGDVVL
jgi:hypothetical protein